MNYGKMTIRVSGLARTVYFTAETLKQAEAMGKLHGLSGLVRDAIREKYEREQELLKQQPKVEAK